LKRIVERAKLHGRFKLHKFRATRITNWLRDGIDIVSVQKMAGHNDLATTSHYLASQQIDLLQTQVEKAAAVRNGGK
jgi:site-specific recombinase XerD